MIHSSHLSDSSLLKSIKIQHRMDIYLVNFDDAASHFITLVSQCRCPDESSCRVPNTTQATISIFTTGFVSIFFLEDSCFRPVDVKKAIPHSLIVSARGDHIYVYIYITYM